jgi:DNA repair exonuclease SbcCD ATPase subunit
VAKAAAALGRLDVLEQEVPERLTAVEQRVSDEVRAVAVEVEGLKAAPVTPAQLDALRSEVTGSSTEALEELRAEIIDHGDSGLAGVSHRLDDVAEQVRSIATEASSLASSVDAGLSRLDSVEQHVERETSRVAESIRTDVRGLAEEIEALKGASVTPAQLETLRREAAGSSTEALEELRTRVVAVRSQVENATSGAAEVTAGVRTMADEIKALQAASVTPGHLDALRREVVGSSTEALEEFRAEVTTLRSEVEEWLVEQISSVRADVIEDVAAGLADPIADLNRRLDELGEQVGSMAAAPVQPPTEPDADIDQRLEVVAATAAEAARKSRQLEPLVELVRKDVARVWEALDGLPAPVAARAAEPVPRSAPPTESPKRSRLRIALPAAVLFVLAVALAWSLLPFRIANRVDCGPALLGATPHTAARKGFVNPKVECSAAGKNRLSESAAAALVAVVGGTGVYAFRRPDSAS